MEPTMKEIAEWLNRAAEFFDEHGRPSEGSDFADRAAQVKAMEPTNIQWKAAIDPVMPPDFKDWWDNSHSDLPLVAALVIRNLRERAEEAEAQLDAMGDNYQRAIKLLVDAEMIFPGSAGRGDISREQRTHADVRRFLTKIYPEDYEKKL